MAAFAVKEEIVRTQDKCQVAPVIIKQEVVMRVDSGAVTRRQSWQPLSRREF